MEFAPMGVGRYGFLTSEVAILDEYLNPALLTNIRKSPYDLEDNKLPWFFMFGNYGHGAGLRKASAKNRRGSWMTWRLSPSFDIKNVQLHLCDPVVPKTIHNVGLEWSKKASAGGIKMTIKTSSRGGFDNEIGNQTVHVPKYSSVHDPLTQMVLFAYTLHGSTFRCPKSITAFNKSGLVITKPKSHSPNTVSARKDVHVLADTAPENHSKTSGLNKNIPKLGDLDSGGFALQNGYNDLHSPTSAPSFGDHGITKAEGKNEHWGLRNIAKAEDDREDWRLANIAKAAYNTEDGRSEKVSWRMATAAVHHATGIRELLYGFTTIKDLRVKAGDGVSMPVRGCGSVITGTVVLQDVWFVPGLTENLVSVAQLTELDYSVGFARGACTIKSATDGLVIGKAHASEDGLFEVDFLKDRPVINW